nr:hypothetical protein [Tanacetum cinerariifolium]GFB36781.1 hypothetical protein [Tanacetum cinerariifolium]
MADHTMEELLQAPTEEYGEAITILVVPNDAIKLMLFPYSLEGAARIWYEKEPPNSILTWDDLVNNLSTNSSLPLRPPTSRMKSLDSHKDSRKHSERLGNVLRKCLEHVPTMDSRS